MEDYGDLFERIMSNTDGIEQVRDLMLLSQVRQKAMELDYFSARWVAAGAQAADISAVLESYNPRLLIGTETNRITEYVKRTGNAPDSSSDSEDGGGARKRSKRKRVGPGAIPEGLSFAPRFEDAFLKCLSFITRHADSGLGSAIRERAKTYPHPALCRYLRRSAYTSYIFSSTTGNLYHAGSRHRNFDAANRRANELELFERRCVDEMLTLLCDMPVPPDMWKGIEEERATGVPNGHTADAPSIRVQFEYLGLHQFDTPFEIETALARVHSMWEENGFLYTSNGRTLPYLVVTKADFEAALAREKEVVPTIQDDSSYAKAKSKVIHELTIREDRLNALLQAAEDAETVDGLVDEIVRSIPELSGDASEDSDPEHLLLGAAVLLTKADETDKLVKEYTKQNVRLNKEMGKLKGVIKDTLRKISHAKSKLEQAAGAQGLVDLLQQSLQKVGELRKDLIEFNQKKTALVEKLTRTQQKYLRLKTLHAEKLLAYARNQEELHAEGVEQRIEDLDNGPTLAHLLEEIEDVVTEGQGALSAAAVVQRMGEVAAHRSERERDRRRGLGARLGSSLIPPSDRESSPTPSQSVSVQLRPPSPSQGSSVSETMRTLVQSGTRMSHAFARIINTAPP
jgi:hypothetical protein